MYELLRVKVCLQEVRAQSKEEEGPKKGPLFHLNVHKEGDNSMSPRHQSSNDNQKKPHSRQGQGSQIRGKGCHCK